jgi:hypothetical protein
MFGTIDQLNRSALMFAAKNAVSDKFFQKLPTFVLGILPAGDSQGTAAKTIGVIGTFMRIILFALFIDDVKGG